jgi:hypothetical protein
MPPIPNSAVFQERLAALPVIYPIVQVSICDSVDNSHTLTPKTAGLNRPSLTNQLTREEIAGAPSVFGALMAKVEAALARLAGTSLNIALF